jgi:hypothetical protein
MGVPDNVMKARHWRLFVDHPIEGDSWSWAYEEGAPLPNLFAMGNTLVIEGTAKQIVADVCAIVTGRGAMFLRK